VRLRRLGLVAALGSVACTPRLVAPLRYEAGPPATDEAFRATPPPLPPVSEAVDAAPRESTLASGLRVVLFERHAYPSIAADLVIDRGPIDLDDPGGNQVAHMMYLYGRGGSAVVNDALRAARRSLQVGSSSSGCAAYFWAAGAASNLGAALSVLAEATFGARLDGAEYEVREGEWSHTAAFRGISVSAAERSVLFGERPYGYVRPELPKLTADEARALHDRLLQPAHATLVVVGDVTPATLDAAAEAAFGSWPPGTPLPRKTEPPPRQSGPRVAVVPRYSLSQIRAAVFARGPDPGSAEAPAFALLGSLLGAPFSSRLFEVLRQETGDAYSPDALVIQERGASWMTINASYDADRAADGVATVLAAIRGVREGRVTEADLAVARATLLATWRSRMSTAAGAAAQYASSLALGAGIDAVRTFPERLATIGLDDVVNVAGRYLTDATLHAIFLGEDRWLDVRSLGMGGLTTLDPTRGDP
jgi:zinc protease